MPGQWWSVSGAVTSRTFINSSGFEMTENQMEVVSGDAQLRKPSGPHVVDYLASNPRFAGIGKITAQRLWDTLGDALFATLDGGDATAIAKVIGSQRASMLVQGWAEEGLSNSLQWLQQFGIPVTIGRRILRYFGGDLHEKVSENPYRLLSFSAGWSEVDALAQVYLGLDPVDERRLAAAVEECVYRRFGLGDTYVPRAELSAGLRSILKSQRHSRDLVGEAIAQSQATGRLLFDREGNVYGLGASILENRIVESIKVRLGRTSPPCDVDRIIGSYERREGHGFKLNKEQRDAVHLIAENSFAVVTGGAGVGKTTVLNCVYDVLDDQGYEVIQLALAGKAVKRIMEATRRPAMTLAGYINKMSESDGQGPTRASNKVALVIDEASMVDLLSFSNIIRLIDDEAKIVLIGDPHQLPPVGPGLILHCLADRPEIPHVELKTVKRFGTTIAALANSVKDGLFPSRDMFSGPIRFCEVTEAELARHAANRYLEKPEDTVVLCATRRTAQAVNQLIQDSLPPGRRAIRLWNLDMDQWENTGFYERDLVICTRNHWDLGIQNGSIGRLIEVVESLPTNGNDDGGRVLGWIEWDDGVKRPLHEELLDSLELGYALTVHKSQGSQWQRVVICLSPTSRLVDRSLVYTALTRSQHEIFLLGNHEALVGAVRRIKAADLRNVGLPKRLTAIA